jgi:alkaline phosphatase D
MTLKITRRQALLGVSSTLLLPAACSTTMVESSGSSGHVFAHGIASGDPDHSSVVIWTRVSGFNDAVEVTWNVATDADFQNIVQRGRFSTNANRDHTVKVVVDSLVPGTDYFYQFAVNDATSVTGRTKTLPVGHVENLTIAVVSCSNFSFGYFNGYEDIANDPGVDIVAHLGDYIYEHGADGYGGETGQRIGRAHSPTHEIVSLADYRQRHAQYKTDAGSLAMHARHPLIVIWDDHETANNPWMGGAENHQPDEGSWQVRRAASMRAFYEWMPVRDPVAGTAPEDYWRHYKFGDLVSLLTLESRHTGRSEQIEYGDLSRFASADEAQAFYKKVVGASDRNFLSRDMEAFLRAEFRESVESGRRWRIIGNQSVMARSIQPTLGDPFFANLRNKLGDGARATLDNLTRLGELGLTGDLDAWAGYPAARERFYDLAKDAGVRDLLVISGDSHAYWANALYDDEGSNMGVELGTTGISSPRSLATLGVEGLQRFDELNAASNREIVWAEGRYRGYIRLVIDHEGAKADFVSVTNIESRDYETRVVHTAEIVGADGSLQYA